MKKALYILVVLVVFAGCSSTAADTSTQSSTPTSVPLAAPTVSFDECMAMAVTNYESSKYEAAIESYRMALDIEPRSFEAYLGLGKSYRGVKQPNKAAEAFVAAQQIKSDDSELAKELGQVYIELNLYEEAEMLVRPFWERESSDMDAGMVLLMSLAAQQRMDEVLALFDNEGLAAYIEAYGDDDMLYFGPVNEAGDRHGYGVAIYDSYIYSGEFANGLRSGQGVWTAGNEYYAGEWANDAPNGRGSVSLAKPEKPVYTGMYINGFEDGERKLDLLSDSGRAVLFVYNVTYGVPAVIRSQDHNGRMVQVIADDQNGSSDFLALKNGLYGVKPWVE